MAKEGKPERRTIKGFLDSKIVQKDVGEETYLTWRENISYALGRGAQGMFTSMTGSKYLNYFLTNILLVRFNGIPGGPMKIASQIRLYCGIFDAINLLNGVDKLVARANQSTAQRVDIGEIVQYRRAGMIV